MIRVAERERVRERLAAAGIMTTIHYPVPVHRQPAYADRLVLVGDMLPVTDRIVPEILSLPLYPELAIAEAARVIDALGAALS